MESKFNFNTVILLLILATLIVGAYALVQGVRRLTQPLEKAEQALQEQVQQITNPTPTIIPDPVTIIRQVQNVSRLETASYTIEKVITAESGQGPFAFLFGDRLILVAHGQVIAGVDLGKMGADDIVIGERGQVIVVLPQAEIFVATLDNQKSYVFDRDTGVVGFQPDLETAARQAAEQEILEAALEDGILDKAQQTAETYVRNLILTLGFDEVIFVQATPVPATPTPTSQ
jgi:hypothetical protein